MSSTVRACLRRKWSRSELALRFGSWSTDRVRSDISGCSRSGSESVIERFRCGRRCIEALLPPTLRNPNDPSDPTPSAPGPVAPPLCWPGPASASMPGPARAKVETLPLTARVEERMSQESERMREELLDHESISPRRFCEASDRRGSI